MILLSLLFSCLGTFGFVHAGDNGTFFRSDVIQSVCKCRPGEWRRYDAFQQAAYPGPEAYPRTRPSPITIEPSLRLDDGLGADDLLAGSGKVVSFNKDDWATAVLRNHDVYILIEDRSELRDVIIRGIRFNVNWVIKVALQVFKAGNWTTFAQKHTPEGENVTEIDFRFSSAECEENCYGLKGQLIRILLEPVDAWHVAEIDGLVVDLCQSDAYYNNNAAPRLHVECLQAPDGRDYVGNVNRSISGRRCLPWSSLVRYQALRSRFPDGLEGAANRCRNPSSVTTGPFCLTRINGKTAEESCHIPSCRLPEAVDMELTCAAGEYCSFYWGNTEGVKVTSTVTLRSSTGGPANELEVFTSVKPNVSVMPDEIEWSKLSDPTFYLIFEFDPEMIISGFNMEIVDVVALTLQHSRDGQQWTPIKTLNIPTIKQATLHRSSWKFGSSSCPFQCSGIKTKYIRLIVKGIGSHVAPKLSLVYIYACRPLEALTSVCEFGPSRLIDSGYRNHVVLRSNLAMVTNIEHILWGIGRSYVQADQASFQETRRRGHQPYVEFSFRTSRTFIAKRVILSSWYVRKMQLLGSMDGKTWVLIGKKNLIDERFDDDDLPLHSKFWPRRTYFTNDAGGCPHNCRGVQVKYLRLVVQESVSAQAPRFKGLEIDVCFNNDTSSVPTVECKSTTNGRSYSGYNQTNSSTGLPCRPWKDSPYWKNSMFPDGTVEEASSYCRHPDSYPRHPGGPWCFTEDGDQYCDIPAC